LFPTFEQSANNPDAPVLTDSIVHELCQGDAARTEGKIHRVDPKFAS
jgi:hypothetical protein